MTGLSRSQVPVLGIVRGWQRRRQPRGMVRSLCVHGSHAHTVPCPNATADRFDRMVATTTASGTRRQLHNANRLMAWAKRFKERVHRPAAAAAAPAKEGSRRSDRPTPQVDANNSTAHAEAEAAAEHMQPTPRWAWRHRRCPLGGIKLYKRDKRNNTWQQLDTGRYIDHLNTGDAGRRHRELRRRRRYCTAPKCHRPPTPGTTNNNKAAGHPRRASPTTTTKPRATHAAHHRPTAGDPQAVSTADAATPNGVAGHHDHFPAPSTQVDRRAATK